MNKALVQKSKNILLIALLTAFIIGMIYTYAIVPMNQTIENIRRRSAKLADRVDLIKMKIKRSEEIRAELDAALTRLQAIETKIPSGDAYLWMLKHLEGLQEPTSVTVSHIAAPKPDDAIVYPKTDYTPVTFTAEGTGFFHDFGRFLAELENNYPYFRLQRLSLEPSSLSVGSGAHDENLHFEVDLATFAKIKTEE